jgi:transcriptional regulator with XRE-family HTH domain
MAKINPFILQKLRRAKRWTPDQLAEMAKVNKQTIWRIEHGKQDNTRERTILQLARALGVEPARLTEETVAQDSLESEPTRQRRQSGLGVSDAASNFLYLISERYFIKPWQVMELAPLLFCWAAEMSLRERRERLDKLEAACATARTLENEMRHLPQLDFSSSEKKIDAEASSIRSHDIFGMCFSEEDLEDGWFYPHNDDTDNPFAIFLSKLVQGISDVAEFDGFSPIDYPGFRVCHKEALDMAGNDAELAEHILDGTVDLYDMPKHLRGFFGKSEDRAAWVRAQVDDYIKRVREVSDRGKSTKEATS